MNDSVRRQQLRAAKAVNYIRVGARVVDITGGGKDLERHLPLGCTYHVCGSAPADAEMAAADLIIAFDAAGALSGLLTRLAKIKRPLLIAADGTPTAAQRMAEAAGFAVEQTELLEDGHVLMLLSPRKPAPARIRTVDVLSCRSSGNFGDRLGVQALTGILPADAQIRWLPLTSGGDFPGDAGDLLILGLGNSLSRPLLTPGLLRFVDRFPAKIGIFGTQYREDLPVDHLNGLLDRLDHWYARHADDALLYGRGRANVSHLGDWLINAFPLARPSDGRCLRIGDMVDGNVPLDRLIIEIQRHRRVLSERLVPLLCALTSAEEVGWIEQYSGGCGGSGKFRSMMLDIFGRAFPETALWTVDRSAVIAYRQAVGGRTAELARSLATILGEAAAPALPSRPVVARTPKPSVKDAIALHSDGRLAEAERIYRECLAAGIEGFDLWHLLGVLCYQTNRAEESVAWITKAIRVNAGVPEGHYNLGLAFRKLARNAEAIQAFELAVVRRPAYVEALVALAAAYVDAGREKDAEKACRKAIALAPNHMDAHTNLSAILVRLGRCAEAVAAGRSAVALDPGSAMARGNLALVLKAAGHMDEAVEVARQTIALVPGEAEYHFNLGIILFAMNRMEESAQAFRDAVALRPDYAEAHWDLSLALLALGDFGGGWREYEWRKRRDKWATFGLPEAGWQGEDIRGKTILLIHEQGLGDSLQFIRYAPLLAERGAKVVAVVPPELRRLVLRIPGITDVVAGATQLPPYDTHCFMLSLPLAFGTTLASIPSSPYLSADAEAAAAWKARFTGDRRLRVGLVWAGNPRAHDPESAAVDKRRSLSIDRFAPILAVPNITFVSLQKNFKPSGETALVDWMGDIGDFADTAALVESLDLVITVDTSVAHLAGGLGKPVWILSRFDSCWRWLLDSDGSPWYPTARLFRQTAPGAWDDVIASVARELAEANAIFAETGSWSAIPLVSGRGEAVSVVSTCTISTRCAGRFTS